MASLDHERGKHRSYVWTFPMYTSGLMCCGVHLGLEGRIFRNIRSTFQELLFYSLHPLRGCSLTCSRSIFHFGTYLRRRVPHLSCVDVGAFGRPGVRKIIDNGPISQYSANMRCHSLLKRGSACFCAPIAISTRTNTMPIHLFDPTKLRAASTLALYVLLASCVYWEAD